MLAALPSNHIEFREYHWSRRWLTFVAVFLLCAAASLSYVYTRPAEYRAASRLQISPARTVAEADDVRPPTLQEQPASFLTEVQTLTSRPVVEDAINRLKREDLLPDLGAHPVDAVLPLIQAQPVEHTQVVELSAEGSQQDLLAQLVNAVADAYSNLTAQKYQQRLSSSYAAVSEELNNLHRQAVAKRAAVNAFREANNIVSLERDENGVLADIENLSRSYSTSLEALAKAQGHLQAMKRVSGAGAVLVGGKDDPTIAAMEQQASTLRDELTDLQRRFTPAYLALDSDANALTERIAGLERQIATQRAASQKTAIASAQEEFETSQTQVNRLGRELAQNQTKAQAFSTQLAEYKVMQEDLDHLENIERLTADRLTRMEASERESAPRVEILDRAAPSLSPVRPDYTMNAAIALTGSFGLGLFAVWFAGFLGGPMPAHSMASDSIPLRPWQGPALRHLAGDPPRLPGEPGILQLLPRDAAPRELEDSEITALVSNASDPVALACVGLLSGLDAAEMTALRWDQIDFAAREIHLGVQPDRVRWLEQPFSTMLQRQQDVADSSPTILHDETGGPWTQDELARVILCAAYDAALSRPDEITPATLRHTYLAWLFRQGIRAADITRIAGNIPHAELVGYMQLAASGTRLPLAEIARVHPAVRNLTASSAQPSP